MRIEAEAQEAARDARLAASGVAIGPLGRPVHSHGSGAGEGAGTNVRSGPLGYPLKAGAGAWIDGGTGQSPAVMCPSGAGTVLGAQFADRPVEECLRRRGYEIRGVQLECAQECERAFVQGGCHRGGVRLGFLDKFFDLFLPAAGAATLIPNIGLAIRDEDRLNRAN